MNTLHAKTFRTALALLALVCVCRPGVYGASKTSPAAFLKVPASAQAMGLGGSAVVSGSGISGAMENPALLGLIKQSEVQSSYGTHLEGYNFLSAGFGRYGELFNGGVSVTRVAASDFEGRDAQGAPTGGFSAADMAINFTAGKSFEQYAGGVTLKYITSSIEDESASAFAADLGAVYSSDKLDRFPYTLGAAVRNIGSPMKYISKSEPLPLTVAAGLAVTLGGGVEAVFNISDSIAESRLTAGMGIGLTVGEGLTLNCGVSREIGAADAGIGELPVGINAGVGFKISNFMLSYGFVPMGEMGNMQRMSVAFKFGEKDGTGEFTPKKGKRYSRKDGLKGW